VKPTDPNFVYDKRKEFRPASDGDDSWDEDNDFWVSHWLRLS